MNLTSVWRHIEEDSHARRVHGRVQRRILPQGRRNLFLGMETPSGNRMFILGVSETSIVGLPSLPDSRGLNVRVTSRESGEAEVVLTLTDPLHRGIFDLLVQDLADAAEEPFDEKAGVVQFFTRLSNWQHLLRGLGRQGLSRKAQQGLWGELWTLREVVSPARGIDAAVNGWRGPLGDDKDFRVDAVCIEVKTSTTTNSEHFEISSERQLDTDDKSTLMLLGLSLVPRKGQGETLPEIVESVRDAASESGCLHILDAKLDLSGYNRSHADQYLSPEYVVRSLHPFRVESEFPRIVPADLPTGTSNVKYLVALAECEPYRIQERTPNKFLEGLL